MPTVSIDTFFACALLVAVALLATASLVGTMQTRMDGMRDLNKQNYLRTVADQIVFSLGSPANWGSGATAPSSFGLHSNDTSHPYDLDVDKVTRLNSQSSLALSYPEVIRAARLNNLALGIKLLQMLSIAVTLSANTTTGAATMYTFMIQVSQAQGPVSAGLHCYMVATDFMADVYNTTSSSGIGYATFQIPNTSNGPALLIVFARATFDDRIIAYEAYSFAHLSETPAPNRTFLGLSPLNHTLNVSQNVPDATVNDGYAFSYAYQANLAAISNSTYAIPTFLDKSPTVLVISGQTSTATFVEWTAYPDVPLQFGTDFENSEENVFVYIVTINGAFYRLTLTFGDVAQ
ncbi:hypothetical protein G4O51_11810 [Candidatus Bathyarchaeota archaeon A05DMB-2]|jgi:hypothetical protein|nr:hypothetical protein [Candidatus Bathyarchaeota archaeon A05DMB-2]